MSNPIEMALFGAGRIGAVHSANIANHASARLKYVCDVNRDAAESLARKVGGTAITDPDVALKDPAVRAVCIATSTDTHVEYILRSVSAGKAVFCEKPIDLDIRKVDACLAELGRSSSPLLMGFNRRFDPNFRAVHDRVRRGDVGRVEMVTIISRDPRPPPVTYIKVSGGLFRDMMIHDFDMARWLLGDEPVEVFATASCLVSGEIGQAGDVDTAMVVLRTAGGALCHIQNSRRSVYGYDQRIEVFGEKGMLQAGNRLETTVAHWGSEGTSTAKVLDFFLERYAEAYRLELDHFLQTVLTGARPDVGARDGRAALVLADAAVESARAGRPVAVKL